MLLVKIVLAGFPRWLWFDLQNYKKETYGKLMFLFLSRFDKGLFEATSNYLGFSVLNMVLNWRNLVRDCSKMALLGLDISKKLIFQWFFNDFKGQSKTMSGPCWVHFGPKS